METWKQRLLAGQNKAVLRIQIRMFLGLLDPDPDPFAKSGSGSFYHQEKKKFKNLGCYCFVTFYDFLSLKNDVNVPRKSNKQKNVAFMDQSMLIFKTSGLLFVRIAQGDFPLAQDDSQRMFASTLITSKTNEWLRTTPEIKNGSLIAPKLHFTMYLSN